MTSERPLDVPLGMPSAEALRLATAAIRRRYVLAETMQHPVVRSECMRLAYLIEAYGLATAPSPPQEDVVAERRRARHGTAPRLRGPPPAVELRAV
jgi:hypothetical protein